MILIWIVGFHFLYRIDPTLLDLNDDCWSGLGPENNLNEIKTLVKFRAAGSSVFIEFWKKIDPINIL